MSHICPNCQSGIESMVVLHGEAHPMRGVRATLRCKGCRTQHMLEGTFESAADTFFRVRKNSRPYRRMM